MSRNLGRTVCYFCEGRVVHGEDPRPITPDDAGPYFAEYEGMHVAKGRCRDCEAKYLCWVRGSQSWSFGHTAHKNYRGPDEHIDLSFLSTFDDEPGQLDLPVFKIGRCRVGADGSLVLLEWKDDISIEQVDQPRLTPVEGSS